MIEVDAHVYYWTPHGMREATCMVPDGYVSVREVERLLEEAHKRGMRQGAESAQAPLSS